MLGTKALAATLATSSILLAAPVAATAQEALSPRPSDGPVVVRVTGSGSQRTLVVCTTNGRQKKCTSRKLTG